MSPLLAAVCHISFRKTSIPKVYVGSHVGDSNEWVGEVFVPSVSPCPGL